eukprot:CAMPEP_0170559954 /NCGR_PEP_ID=MMETSP0211-20121228/46151_1 /TAXON_ID=311385 /ORGANISM="Pseudokeronopsis sp., Strain OXSARD2" /LENGTH=31 /DNA_ID= /DNA_START= /DNA_END= /DNA_ORIENTATION=
MKGILRLSYNDEKKEVLVVENVWKKVMDQFP